MFHEAVYSSLLPLIGDEYSPTEISNLANHIAELCEVNPREGNSVPYLRDSILEYLESPQTLANFQKIQNQKTQISTELGQLSAGLADLDKISAQTLRESLQVQVVDVKVAKEVYLLNFGYKQTLGEIIEACKNTKGSLGFV